MIYLNDSIKFPKNANLILGFFDGIHAGHQKVINSANKKNSVLITFSTSPAEHFKKSTEYIYSRNYNYELISNLDIEYIWEQDFSKIANLTAKKYLENLINIFEPKSITTGFNHSFGLNREGNSAFLKKYENFIYYNCVEPYKINDTIVSSTKIKEFLRNGDIKQANKFLTRNFKIKSKVIEGQKLGRQLGFPTANMKYPNKIVKIPYGVYKVKVFEKNAVMNWGIKPTIGYNEEVIEIHIPNFNENLYEKELDIDIISKIRDEQKFENIDELKAQISKDIEICLES